MFCYTYSHNENLDTIIDKTDEIVDNVDTIIDKKRWNSWQCCKHSKGQT